MSATAQRERAWWRADNTDVRTVVRELARLEAESLGHHQGHATTRTLNLVVAPAEFTYAVTVEDRLDSLRTRHPARTLTLREHAPTRLDAEVAIECEGAGGGGSSFCHDEVRLAADPTRLAHADSLLRPLLVTGLETVVWLPDPDEGPADQALLELAELVVLDTAAGPHRSTLPRAERCAARAPVHDLAWGRLDRWRARVAAAFEPQARRALLGRLERLDVEFGGARSDALLLLGWIAARASWRLERLEETDEGFTARARRSGGGQVEVTLDDRPEPGGAGQIAQVRLGAGDDELVLERGPVVEHPADEFLDALSPSEKYLSGYLEALAVITGALRGGADGADSRPRAYWSR